MTTLTKREKATPRHWFDRGPLANLREEMDELFENFFGERALPSETHEMIPKLDVSETDDSVEVKTDLPGVKADEIDIQVRDNYLTITGEHSEESESEGGDGRKYHRVERRQGSFFRSVWLPCDVDQDNVEAELKDGVLTVSMAKSEEAKSRKIAVKG